MDPNQEFDDDSTPIKMKDLFMPTEVIGKGAFGVVYKAVHKKSNNFVAVKVGIPSLFHLPDIR